MSPHRTGKFELFGNGFLGCSSFRLREWRNPDTYNEIGSLDLDDLFDLRSLADRAIRIATREREDYIRDKRRVRGEQ